MRQFLTDEYGEKLLAPRRREAQKLLFQIAETIERDCGVNTNVVNTYDPLTDKVWLGIQLLPVETAAITDAARTKMRALWREFIK